MDMRIRRDEALLLRQLRIAERRCDMNAARRERSKLIREANAARRQGLTARVQQLLGMAGKIHVVPPR